MADHGRHKKMPKKWSKALGKRNAKIIASNVKASNRSILTRTGKLGQLIKQMHVEGGTMGSDPGNQSWKMEKTAAKAKARNTVIHQDGEVYRRSNVPKDSEIQRARAFNTGKSLLSKAVSSVVRFAGPAGVALSAITSSKPLNVGEAEFLENEKRKVHRARKRK
jgi:hypothetical protein